MDEAERLITGLEVGQQIELIRDIERYPHFTARAGSIGTLIEVDGHSITAHMDEHIPGAEEWDNEVVWMLSEMDDIHKEMKRI